MAKRGTSRLGIRLAMLVATAGLALAVYAEAPPVRPSPGDKPAAESAKTRIRVLQHGTYRPAIPAPSGQARKQPLSPDDKKKIFGTDTGVSHLTLSVGNSFVDGKGYLTYVRPGGVAPAQGVATFHANQGALHLTLHVEPKKFYFIDLTVSPSPYSKTSPCGFEIIWPDKANDYVACHGETNEHLLLGFQAPPAAGTMWMTFIAKQTTSFYRLEVTAK